MADIIVSIILLLIVGWACYYIYKNKKNGAKCLGCASSTCNGSKNCSCNKNV